jgi:formylglycine-generating enzyme required for sulfatase activity
MPPIRSTLLALCMLLSAPLLHAAEARIALVIGNSDYASGPLSNPANDAKLIGDELASLGFDVIARRNADQTTMKRAIEEFGARLDKAGPDSVGLFYYAGHGVQLNGRNYLIPTTARIEREGDVEIEAVSADWVVEQMRFARNRLNIVILDACRNNPFTRSMRSADHGLATMDAPAGILIAYSTAPGSVAADGAGRNSPYTEALTRAMRELHEPVEQVFKHVRLGVMSVTAGKQVPWESSSLTGDFYFSAPGTAPLSAHADGATPPTDSSPAGKPDSGGFVAWVMGLFGPGTPATDAKPAVASIPAAPGSAPLPGPAPQAAGPLMAGARAVPLLQSLGIQIGEIDAAHNYPQSAIRQLIDATPRQVTLGSTPEQIHAAFTLCRQYSSACRVSWYGDEVLRNVRLAPFELDTAPVSVRDFREFVETSGYKTQAEKAGFAYAVVEGSLRAVTGGSWRNAVKGHVADDAAVVAVSFQDAAAYCHAKGERLPTEDEWEYVARGPQRYTFPWGENADPAAAAAGAAPRVTDGPAEGIGGRYKGLSGNVWQWVNSTVGDRKVLKGGSWLESNPANKRAAARRYELPSRADEDSGFRCAKSAAAWPDAGVWLALTG